MTRFELKKDNKTWSSLEYEKNTVRLHIDIDTICNHKCPYCYARADKHNWGIFMSREYVHNVLLPELSKLYKSLSERNKHLDIVLLGGEPTLHPLFNEIVEHISSMDTRVSITSNGTNSYNSLKGRKNVRWAFTYHPSQVSDMETWIKNILHEKDSWWEVAVSPLIDCWGTEEEILHNSGKIKKIIEICHNNNIKVQPTFQFNPYESGDIHIDMSKVITYYSYLEEEKPIYTFGETDINDYTVLKRGYHNLKGCMCINNNFQLTVRGDISRCCTNEYVSWKELPNVNNEIICPLKECTCYGFLSLYKEL